MAENPTTQDKAREALEAAAMFIRSQPHAPQCASQFDPDERCTCGRDALLSKQTEALSLLSAPVGEQEPVDIGSKIERRVHIYDVVLRGTNVDDDEREKRLAIFTHGLRDGASLFTHPPPQDRDKLVERIRAIRKDFERRWKKDMSGFSELFPKGECKSHHPRQNIINQVLCEGCDLRVDKNDVSDLYMASRLTSLFTPNTEKK